MPSPFYNAIKGITAGAAGTGAFTPSAASAGYRAWSTVPAGWIGLVRFEDAAAAWELQYSYWSGTTLSRSATTQFVASSSGSALTLTSAATAAMVPDASEIMPHLGTTPWRCWTPQPAQASTTNLGFNAPTVVGSAAVSLATTNFYTEQPGYGSTSASTANAQGGFYHSVAQAVFSTTAGRGGYDFVGRFGASQIPTGPRLFVGMTSATYFGSTAEPSAFVGHLTTFAKDSTDTNIQLLVNDNSGGGAKTDTGIALVANGWYEASVWAEPGGGRVYGLLTRLDTGAIWYGSTNTGIPNAATSMIPQMLFGLNGTNTGTTFVTKSGGYMIRSGA